MSPARIKYFSVLKEKEIFFGQTALSSDTAMNSLIRRISAGAKLSTRYFVETYVTPQTVVVKRAAMCPDKMFLSMVKYANTRKYRQGTSPLRCLFYT